MTRVDRHDRRRGLDQLRNAAGRHGQSELHRQFARLLRKPCCVTNSGELGKIDVGQVSNFRTVQNGIYAIDMPDFYLAHTETTTPSTPR